MDADTPADFHALRCLEMEQHNKSGLWPDIQIHVSRYNTILTPETAQFLEMIEYTGSIQKACTCMHLSFSNGTELLNRMEQDLGYSLTTFSSADPSGNSNSLTSKGRILLKAYQAYQDAVSNYAKELFHEIFPEDLHT